MMPTRVAPAGSTTAFACEDTIHLRRSGATPVDCSLSCRHYRLNASLPQHSECDRDFGKQCPLSTPTGRGLETPAQPRSRVRFLGSELLAPADAHAFLASPARYGPDWLVCPSWLKAGMPPMFTDASCGARCAHLKF